MITAMTTGNSGNTPAQRIGHRERDAAVERLRVAAGEGQITFDELETRMEAALAARTADDIAVLIADLPVPAGTPSALEPAPAMRQAARHSSVERLGMWRVPEQIELELRHSSCVLDLRTPTLPGNGVRIQVDARHSSVKLLVAQDAHVELDNVSRHHSATKDRGLHQASGWSGPTIVVSGTLHHSSVRVLRPADHSVGRVLWWRRRRRAELIAASGRSRALPPGA
jgi:uncharacterized protein DUF1707